MASGTFLPQCALGVFELFPFPAQVFFFAEFLVPSERSRPGEPALPHPRL